MYIAQFNKFDSAHSLVAHKFTAVDKNTINCDETVRTVLSVDAVTTLRDVYQSRVNDLNNRKVLTALQQVELTQDTNRVTELQTAIDAAAAL